MPTLSTPRVFHCKSKDGRAHARAEFRDEAFAIIVGSTALGSRDAKFCKVLEDEGVWRYDSENRVYVFLKERIFRGPSAAASVVLKRDRPSGWQVWRDESGRAMKAGPLYEMVA